MFGAALFVIASVAGRPDARAAELIDCPLRDAPFSVDMPLMDVLLSESALALVQTTDPDGWAALPEFFRGTASPTFSAIVTLRSLAGTMHTSDEMLAALDSGLRALPVSDSDRIARCARYDTEAPDLQFEGRRPRVLLFEKITGFRDGPSVTAGHDAFVAMAARNHWNLDSTESGAAFSPDLLRNVDVVVWNNVSGDVLTLSQRAAFKSYIEGGGGFVAVHGSGGDPVYFWDWYVDTLIGARFKGHPGNPQFQAAAIKIETTPSALGADLAPGWTMTDEWYSFRSNPRDSGAHVVATLDESTYVAPPNLQMGPDHPIAWTQCVGNGRAFYSAIGHMPETYSEPHYVQLLDEAMHWAMGRGRTRCESGQEVARR